MKFPVTPKGLDKIKSELSAMKAERPLIADEIESAREHGDLKENAEYHAAKEKSGILEAKIRDLEAKISNAEVIDPLKISNPQKVVFGVSVEIEDLDSGVSKNYTIFGEVESDTKKGIISIDTPLAKALIGKQVGDVVEINLPGGRREYEILGISVPEIN